MHELGGVHLKRLKLRLQLFCVSMKILLFFMCKKHANRRIFIVLKLGQFVTVLGSVFSWQH